MIRIGTRVAALVVAAFLGSAGGLAFPTGPASASPGTAARAAGAVQGPGLPVRAPGKACSVEEWRNPAMFDTCVNGLADVGSNRAQCVVAPTPEKPDSGMAGWFASEPAAAKEKGYKGLYTKYGYAGYDYTTYDINCVQTTMHPDYKAENTLANGEFMVATSIIAASNALRERAWDPQTMWGWANPLVEKATKAVYDKVFSVFGALTLMVIGLYLLWRSRQSDMSATMTTAGWAVLVMVAVTAIAAWPVFSANLADRTLVTGLSAVHGAVGPPEHVTPKQDCVLDTSACTDNRPPAVRASDTAVEGIIYKNWLRGEFGSADSATAYKYGPVMYDAKSYKWSEASLIKGDPGTQNRLAQVKSQHWMKVAEQIKREDPDAYRYVQGTQGMDRIGAGLIAILSAIFFAMFDLTASILVLLGFLIFRWAVIAAPVLGTIGMLRPASAGLRRLVNAVVAAMFNIIIFGTGAAIYLFAVDLIMGTASLPGWLQVMLIWFTGIVGWLLLRPYRRITQLGGKNGSTELASAGTWHRRFFRDLRQAATLSVLTPDGTPEQPGARRVGALREVRPETRVDPVGTSAPTRSETGSPADPSSTRPPAPVGTTAAEPVASARRSGGSRWIEPDVPDEPPMYTIYRPDSGRVEVPSRPAARPEPAVRRS